MNRAQIIKALKKRLHPRRYLHTLGVEKTALALSDAYGCDREKVSVAALLHDCAKHMRLSDCAQYGFVPDAETRQIPKLIHAGLGSAVAEKDFGVTDREVLDAIRYHTTGKADMTMLEKIIFIADAIEPDRKYPNVDILRQKAYEDIDEAVMMYLDNMIKYNEGKGNDIHSQSVEALNYLKEKKERT